MAGGVRGPCGGGGGGGGPPPRGVGRACWGAGGRAPPRVAPTVVARDRVEGARMAVAIGASVIVMDDGFQNPSLAKDLSLLVVDARRGIGNGRTIPAGPLRAPLQGQLARAHALVMVGPSARAAGVIAHALPFKMPVLHARLRSEAGLSATLASGRVLAFAGIADPQKFFATLAE